MKPDHILLVLLACACPLTACDKELKHETVQSVTQSSLERLIEHFPMFSGTIIVAQDGAITAEANVGMADRRSGRLIDRQTLFSIASVGKMFTAVAISQLVESGKLAFDTAVTERIPELAGRISESVTIDSLLHHTSGMEMISGVDDETIDALQSNHDYFRLILKSGIGSTGPAEFAYRNENFQLLGEIVERVSGQSFESYVHEHITVPLGMVGPVYARRDRQDSLPIATPYMAVDYETWWNSEDEIEAKNVEDFVHVPPAETPSAGGGPYASAHDMFLFASALRNGSLISPESFEAMCLLSQTESSGNRSYGRGCAASHEDTGVRVGHTGSTAGVQARFFIYPNDDIVIIVLSNHDAQAAPIFGALEELMYTH